MVDVRFRSANELEILSLCTVDHKIGTCMQHQPNVRLLNSKRLATAKIRHIISYQNTACVLLVYAS